MKDYTITTNISLPSTTREWELYEGPDAIAEDCTRVLLQSFALFSAKLASDENPEDAIGAANRDLQKNLECFDEWGVFDSEPRFQMRFYWKKYLRVALSEYPERACEDLADFIG